MYPNKETGHLPTSKDRALTPLQKKLNQPIGKDRALTPLYKKLNKK